MRKVAARPLAAGEEAREPPLFTVRLYVYAGADSLRIVRGVVPIVDP